MQNQVAVPGDLTFGTLKCDTGSMIKWSRFLVVERDDKQMQCASVLTPCACD